MISSNALMNLQNRWPRDSIDTSSSSSVRLRDIVPRASETSVYKSSLSLDQADSEVIKKFAIDNNFSYTDIGGLPAGIDTPGWFGLSLSTNAPIFAHKIEGTLFGFSVSMQLAYSTEDINNGIVSIGSRRSVVHVSLPKTFPQVVLDSNKNDKTAIGSTTASYASSQKMQLEGNFSQYFDLFVPRGVHINALSLLAPNFMEQLINSSAFFDVEFIGNDLYFITKDPIFTPKHIQQTIDIIETQLTYMSRLLSSWNYRPSELPYDRLHSTSVQGETIKIGRHRISPGVFLTAVMLFMILAFIYALSQPGISPLQE